MGSRRLLLWPRVKEITEENPDDSCDLCKRTEVQSSQLGPLLRYNTVIAHHYCMLFSSNLSQDGRDHEGIRGFLIPDIKKEIERGQKLRCGFCRKNGATIGCGVKKCRSKYHLPCALESGVQVQFMENHATYCNKHRDHQEIPKDIASTCSICYDEIVIHPRKPLSTSCIMLPCCGLKNKNVFHKSCLSSYANSSGNCFKCPLCGSDEDAIKDVVLRFGVNIPDQDPSWEMDEEYFADLYEEYEHCDMPSCQCPNGRTYDGIIQPNPFATSGPGSRKIEWFLARCQSCAAKGGHIRCIKKTYTGLLPFDPNAWECDECEKVGGRVHSYTATATSIVIQSESPSQSDVDVAFAELSDEPQSPVPVPQTSPGRRRRGRGRPRRRAAEPSRESDSSANKPKRTRVC